MRGRRHAGESGEGAHDSQAVRVNRCLQVPTGTRGDDGEYVRPCRAQRRPVAIAASCGYKTLKVTRKPRFLIVNTGNELVDTAEIPLPHQIRMSNGILLEALIKKWGGRSKRIKVNDDKETIKTLLQNWQNKVDAILFTGGVSMGKSDYVPEVLKAEKFEILFHGVAQRPGKPFLFARKENCLVFGFPGNPVSVSVCANYYLKAWIHNVTKGKELRLKKVKLGKAFSFDKKL